MPAFTATSQIPPDPSALDAAEIRTAWLAWLLFIAGTCGYCLTYQAVVGAMTPDVSRTVMVALREWGAWAVLAPLAFKLARRVDPGSPDRGQHYAILGLAMASLAALVPIVADQVTDVRSLSSSIAIFWPRNVAAAVVVHLIWHVSLRPRVASPVAPAVPVAEESRRPETLLVSKGADQCLIRTEDIQYLSAAGNYIDICARDQRYLLRATMAQIEELLPPERFVRIHRSHIVHLDQIERIRVQRSGSGTVHLRCGAQLGISRSYRARWKGEPGRAR